MLSLVSAAPLPYITITRLVMGMGDGKREGDRETSKREQNGVHKTSSPIVAWSQPDFCDFIYHHIYRETYTKTHIALESERSHCRFDVSRSCFSTKDNTQRYLVVHVNRVRPKATKTNWFWSPYFIYMSVFVYTSRYDEAFFLLLLQCDVISVKFYVFFAFHTH